MKRGARSLAVLALAFAAAVFLPPEDLCAKLNIGIVSAVKNKVSKLKEKKTAAEAAADSNHAPDVTQAGGGYWVSYVNHNNVMSMVKEGNYLWCGTTGGVVKWDLTAGTYQVYTTANGLANNYVYAIAIDASGNKWFGTDGGVSMKAGD